LTHQSLFLFLSISIVVNFANKIYLASAYKTKRSKELKNLNFLQIKRTVGYDQVKEELKKWDSVVARNRTAEQLSFPLKRLTPLKDSHTSKIPEFLRGFSTKSDLMKKFEEVDPTLLYPAEEEEEKDNKHKITLEEVILRRKTVAKFRAQQV